jgi:hypothetical protein
MAVLILANTWIGTNAERLAQTVAAGDRLHWIETDSAPAGKAWYYTGSAWVAVAGGSGGGGGYPEQLGHMGF